MWFQYFKSAFILERVTKVEAYMAGYRNVAEFSTSCEETRTGCLCIDILVSY